MEVIVAIVNPAGVEILLLAIPATNKIKDGEVNTDDIVDSAVVGN